MVIAAALFVDPQGTYSRIPGVDLWGEERDARLYRGPYPVVAHPPCERWGKFWHGSSRKPHQFKLGDDGGCFASALASVRRWGGILEHPASSHAWKAHGISRPLRSGGWIAADEFGGYTCWVEQGHYGHPSRKETWLYAKGIRFPSLIWGRSQQRICDDSLIRHGYEAARRRGNLAASTNRDSTPRAFAELLLGCLPLTPPA